MRPQYTAALLFLAATVFVAGCEKPEGDVGLQLQPSEDILHVSKIDTFSIVSYTLEEDSLRTDKLNPAIVGAYLDPVFGVAEASHITELRLSTSNPDFLNGAALSDIIMDSLVLSLTYESSLSGGKTYAGEGAQYFEVFEIADSLSVDSIYYDNREATLIGDDLVVEGMNLIKPNTRDSVSVGDEMVAPQLRIPLDTSFVHRIFEESLNGPISAEKFVSLIKGICIKVDGDQQNLRRSGMIYFDTFRANSQLTMYYRNTNPDPNDPNAETLVVAYPFDIRSNTGKYEDFDQDYSYATGSLARQVNGQKELGQRDLFVQAMSGTKLRIELPTIESLKDSTNIAINKAELILPARTSFGRSLAVPTRMFLFGLDEDERIYVLDDQLDGVINGFYDETIPGYRFIITRQIQQIILGQKENFGFEVVTNRAGDSANRVVLNGPDYPSAENPMNNLKLTVTYTKF